MKLKSGKKQVMRSLYKIPCGTENMYMEQFVMSHKNPKEVARELPES